MAKFSRFSKLSQAEQEALLISFCKALVELKTPEEAAHFLKDLLSKQEAEMLAKRIEIARLLIEGHKYEDIQKILKVSQGTISRVSLWLATSGQGYRLIAKRVKPDYINELDKAVSWKQIKRRYPSYFWPELILEEFVKNAKKKQKEKMRAVLSEFDKKSETFEKLQELLKEEYKPRKNFNTTKY